MVEIIEKKVLSVDGTHQLWGRVFIPKEKEIIGLFHVVHGMTEHIRRYESFMTKIAELGYVCFGYDHLGHGYTVNDDSELGFIAHRDGWKLLVQDVYKFGSIIKKEYGENLPYILMGHSMGSFIVREVEVINPIANKLIVMGTGGPNPAAAIGLGLAKMIRGIKGDKHISKLVYDLAFGSYNKKFGDDCSVNWLSVDEENKKKYLADKYCTFKFTISGLVDLITLNKDCNSGKWFKTINKELPILLVSGEDDPVGDYGKGVKAVYEKLQKSNCNVEMKLYEGFRHEILNEECKDDVFTKIKEFIEK